MDLEIKVFNQITEHGPSSYQQKAKGNAGHMNGEMCV